MEVNGSGRAPSKLIKQPICSAATPIIATIRLLRGSQRLILVDFVVDGGDDFFTVVYLGVLTVCFRCQLHPFNATDVHTRI